MGTTSHSHLFTQLSDLPSPGTVLRRDGEDSMFIGFRVTKRPAEGGREVEMDFLVTKLGAQIPLDGGELTLVTACETIAQATEYPVSPELARRFDEFIRHEANDLVHEVAARAHELGHRIVVMGGAVRDLVMGKSTTEVNDLDMSGTIPPVMFADLVRLTALEMCEPSDTGTLQARRRSTSHVEVPSVQVSKNGIVHVSRFTFDKSAKVWAERKFLEYGPYKTVPIGTPEYGAPEFLTGFSPVIDVSSRDMTINALSYDPTTKTILDPAGVLDPANENHGITGYHGSQLASWSESTAPHAVRLVPIPLGEWAKSFWRAKALARVLKATAKFPDADLEPARTWLRENNSLSTLPATRHGVHAGAAATVQAHLLSVFSDLDSDDLARRDNAYQRLMTAATRLTGDDQELSWLNARITEALGPVDHTIRRPSRWPDGAELAAVFAYDASHKYEFTSSTKVLTAVDEGPGAVRFWRRQVRDLTSTAVVVAYSSESGDQSKRVVGFIEGNNVHVPLTADEVPQATAYARESLRQEDWDRLGRLFGEHVHLTLSPDYEAPDPSDAEGAQHWKTWEARGWLPPKNLRSRPAPGPLAMTEADMSQPMRDMELLKRAIRAGFVEVGDGFTDLYWACLGSGTVRLSPAGVFELQDHS